MSNANPGPDVRRVCLITGATSGIGRAAAVALAGHGFDLLLNGRNLERGAAVVMEVDEIAGRPAGRYLPADLSSQAEIRRLADEVRLHTQRLDVLVHGAGVIYGDRRESTDGIELTWAVNHLAPFLLTHLLWDVLVAAAPSRVIVVTSRNHRQGRIHWQDPELHRGYNLPRAYAQSKLANVLFTNELARRGAAVGVHATAVHPGLVLTAIVRDLWPPVAAAWRLGARLFGHSAARGAAPVVWAATDPDPQRWNGAYLGPRGRQHPSRRALRTRDAARLWHLSANRVGLPVKRPVDRAEAA